MARITAAIERSRSSDPEDVAGAAADFDAIWAEIGADGDPFHRCVLAHYAADVAPELTDELTWDQRALAAAAEVTDERVQRHHAGLRIAAFYPSLHLNLAEDHRQLGDVEQAREHLRHARERLHVLGSGGADGYAATIRTALDRIERELGG
ncbi:hypothetical protein HF519_21750 [Pseudonocardia bannensis]|uniref:Tetratricopeptide repeat protein n=2 Tax=Pseudonocardia bannensis TaxID=630973 RepID=A0A848DN21_9PSEU|nr:hypothetical protein [Pseudonocardia bannensis]